MNKSTELSISRARLVVLFDQMFEARNVQEENEFAAELNFVSGRIWELMTGGKDAPPVIEFCLPSWHRNFQDPRDYLGEEK